MNNQPSVQVESVLHSRRKNIGGRSSYDCGGNRGRGARTKSWNTQEKERGRERTKGKFDRSVLREVDSRRNGRTTRRVLDGNKARNFVRLEPCAPAIIHRRATFPPLLPGNKVLDPVRLEFPGFPARPSEPRTGLFLTVHLDSTRLCATLRETPSTKCFNLGGRGVPVSWTTLGRWRQIDSRGETRSLRTG